jgi:hypothetical protein
MAWVIRPELIEEDVQAALLAAVERELAQGDPSLWWRSGLDDLDGGPAPKEAWSDPGIVEP